MLREGTHGCTYQEAGAHCAQITALLLISKAGSVFVGALQLPLPGNLVGMPLLFALLTSGVSRLE
jgi:holin-like protein